MNYLWRAYGLLYNSRTDNLRSTFTCLCLMCPLAHVSQGDRGHHAIIGVSVRVLSEVCAEVFEVLISSLLGWVVKLNGGTVCLSEGTALPRIPSTAGPGTLIWAVSSQRLPWMRASMALCSARAHTHTYTKKVLNFSGYLLNVKYLQHRLKIRHLHLFLTSQAEQKNSWNRIKIPLESHFQDS